LPQYDPLVLRCCPLFRHCYGCSLQPEADKQVKAVEQFQPDEQTYLVSTGKRQLPPSQAPILLQREPGSILDASSYCQPVLFTIEFPVPPPAAKPADTSPLSPHT